MRISDYTQSLNKEQRDVIQCLHDLIAENPGIEIKKRWNLPFYYRKSWICYFNILKNGIVEWGFTRGNELSNEEGWLKTKGRKQILSAEFKRVQEIDIEVARQYIQEALLLDEHVTYRVKRKSKD
jgi:hypothetical protein